MKSGYDIQDEFQENLLKLRDLARKNIYLTTRADFGKMAELYRDTGLGAEIGVQYGVNAERIAKDYKGTLLCVDLWNDRAIHDDACARLGVFPNVIFDKQDSISAAADVEDGSLDFVYIDANHFREEVLADIRAWYPKVRSGGIIAGHDYCHYQDIEVIQAVTEWAAETGYEITVTPYHEADCWQGTHFPTWYTIKK